MIPQSKWVWYGMPGHFICGSRCVFHLATKVGGVLVSTVGLFKANPDDEEYEDIGYGRKLETMVFRVGCGVCSVKDCGCGMPTPTGWSEVDFLPANTVGEAQKNHYKLCKKWAKEQK